MELGLSLPDVDDDAADVHDNAVVAVGENDATAQRLRENLMNNFHFIIRYSKHVLCTRSYS